MLNYKTREEAQKAASRIIVLKDWESDSLTVKKAYQPLHGVTGYILLDAWSKPLEGA